MLKSGAKVVCINNKNNKDLIIGNVYTMSLHLLASDRNPDAFPEMYILNEISFHQLPSNFCTLREHRNMKLKNIELCLK